MALLQGLRVPIEPVPNGIAETTQRDDAPAIRTVDEIFDSAIHSRASDVHLEPIHEGGLVRERVDGRLREVRRVPHALFLPILSRIKLLAGMDIADRRQPQDGRYAIETREHSVDARVSSMPTIAGERLVVRLLNLHARVPSLRALGMSAELSRSYCELLHAPSGFVVVCGPTGSGKTTTLYASLRERNDASQHLCTVEDPVEVRLDGVAQVQVNAKAGVTFAGTLRAFLRQDPDAVMIGEMRDAETASVAISGALSGRLLLTTLHSHDALGAIERLLELGVHSRALASALSGVLAQRLVRQLCSYCKRRVEAGSSVAERWAIAAESGIHEAVGCAHCAGSGYWGRSAVFEWLRISDEMRAEMSSDPSPGRLRELAAAQGYQPMRSGAIASLLDGETSVDEIARVLGPGAALCR